MGGNRKERKWTSWTRWKPGMHGAHHLEKKIFAEINNCIAVMETVILIRNTLFAQKKNKKKL